MEAELAKDLNLFKREMREKTDGFRAEVGAAQRAVSAVFEDLRRLEKDTASAVDGWVSCASRLHCAHCSLLLASRCCSPSFFLSLLYVVHSFFCPSPSAALFFLCSFAESLAVNRIRRGREVGGLESRVMALESMLQTHAKGLEASRGDSGQQFEAVNSDMAELGVAVTALRTATKRLETGLEGELSARRATNEQLVTQIASLRSALSSSSEESVRRMATMLQPVDSKLSASLDEVGRNLYLSVRQLSRQTGRQRFSFFSLIYHV